MNVFVLALDLLLSDFAGLPAALGKHIIHASSRLIRVKHVLSKRNKVSLLQNHLNDRARHVEQFNLVLGNARWLGETIPTSLAEFLHSTKGFLDMLVADQGLGQGIHLIVIHRDNTSLAVPLAQRFYTAVSA